MILNYVTQLKSCPFCGAGGEHTSGVGIGACVRCNKCGAQGPFFHAEDDVAKANAAWNARVNPIDNWQPKMVNWVRTRLGSAAMDPHERAMRFLEEALELLQVAGITEDEIDKLRLHVFSKQPGRAVQEIGGVVTTLLTLAQSQGVDMNTAGLVEIDRSHRI